jgi:hypothetical protein
MEIADFDLMAAFFKMHSDEGPPFGAAGWVPLDDDSMRHLRQRTLRWD